MTFNLFFWRPKVQPTSIPESGMSIPAPEPKYIITNDGNMTIQWHGKAHSIGKTHPNYDAIRTVLLNKSVGELDKLLDIPAAIQKAFVGVTVDDFGQVFYEGQPMHNAIAVKIGEFVRKGLPFKPLVRFLGNLMENPSERSRNELYNFLMHQGFPITHDGCFMAYKGIRADFKDHHTGLFDNSIGSVLEMPRDQVDPDSNNHCSVGFHVGTHQYASTFGQGTLVLVKVNPRDAVSVPSDHDASKLRVCRYEVVEVCPGIVQEPLYGRPEAEPEDDIEEDFDEEECPDCGEVDCDGECNDESDELDPETLDDLDDTDIKPAPKRPACSYCHAKGGKKHDPRCSRP